MDDFKDSCEKIGGQFEILSYKRPFSIDKEDMLIPFLAKALVESGEACIKKKTTHSTEANIFSRFKIPAVVFGAGISQNNVNTPNEANNLKAIYKSVDIYKAVMKELVK